MRSVAHALACGETAGLPPDALEFQALRGMAEELKQALIESGHRVREYVPIGALLPGMAYLVRRLLENTSNESFLRASIAPATRDDELLAPPHVLAAAPASESGGRDALPSPDSLLADGRPFCNEPHRDFSDPAQRSTFVAAVAAVQLPSRPRDCTSQEVHDAVGVALGAFDAWRSRPDETRSQIILKAAALLRRQRDALCGLMICEAGKTWAEADADVCEAIDFCEFYAREAVRLFRPERLDSFTGEDNVVLHEPRGVAVVISPWNFPLAICTGMTVAALATGNTALLKPAEQTPIIAMRLCEALWEAGVPPQVMQFVPGAGEVIGAELVRDPRIALVAFTGSAAVGLNILHATAPATEPAADLADQACRLRDGRQERHHR